MAAATSDRGSSASSSTSDPLDFTNDEGYEDVEPDVEQIEVVGLFDEKVFKDPRGVLRDAKERFGFDFLEVKKRLGLDFYDLIKLVNYIRSEVKSGNKNPDVSSKDKFSDDKYLQPVLEDDALLFSLDDLTEEDIAESSTAKLDSLQKEDLVAKVTELEEQLQRLQKDYTTYKEIAEKTLDDRWNSAVETAGPRKDLKEDGQAEVDKGYFSSYSFTDIHETMIKDAIRTNAYRDFIENNPDLFRGKVVLDIGCGSGILSMFCARSGASRVIAVDNSDIIDTARLNIHANGYDDTIVCVRGKIEEVTLPLPKVDIIVSEWMGYALLFEGMLDSVIWARDRYLKPDGLMVPSHCTMHLAAAKNDPTLQQKRQFWKDVYGFNMTSTVENDAYDRENCRVEYFDKKDVAKPDSCFLELDLHKATVPELSFKNAFSLTLDEDVESFAGWVAWFDILFLKDRKLSMTEPIMNPRNDGSVAFTTGPYGPETHWKCAFFSTHKVAQQALKKGTKIAGHIEFEKTASSLRGLVITIDWEAEGAQEKGDHKWLVS